jgi:hypothetical protein
VADFDEGMIEAGTFVVKLPEGLEKLPLVTDTLGDGSWDWSYWGPILPMQ